MRDDDLPDPRQDDETETDIAVTGDEEALRDASLTEEITSLIEDGKTYAEAELAYQKTRAGFVADRGKSAALYGLFALGFVHLALIALVVGMVLALTPSLGALGATGAVVGALLLGVLILLLRLRAKAREISEAFKDEG